jgi:hypothetical protein
MQTSSPKDPQDTRSPESVEVHKNVRALITETDHMSRHAHAAHDEATSARFASLRSTLQRLDRWLGSGERRAGLAGEIDLVFQRVRDAAARATGEEAAELAPLVAHAEALRARTRDVALERRWLESTPFRAASGVAGLALIATPFALGYWRRSPLAAALQIACGLGTLAAPWAARFLGPGRAHA